MVWFNPRLNLEDNLTDTIANAIAKLKADQQVLEREETLAGERVVTAQREQRELGKRVARVESAIEALQRIDGDA